MYVDTYMHVYIVIYMAFLTFFASLLLAAGYNYIYVQYECTTLFLYNCVSMA